LPVNNYAKVGGAKSGRGGRALLGRTPFLWTLWRRIEWKLLWPFAGQPVYRCNLPNQMLGLPRCLTVARELLRAVAPMAIEAALEAERMHMDSQAEQQRHCRAGAAAGRYEASLAERPLAAAIPTIALNRLRSSRRAGGPALQSSAACQSDWKQCDADPTAAKPDSPDLAAAPARQCAVVRLGCPCAFARLLVRPRLPSAQRPREALGQPSGTGANPNI